MARRDRPDPPDRGPTPDPRLVMDYWTKMGLAEPDAPTKAIAQFARGYFSAFVMEGFSQEQAMALTQTMLTASINASRKPNQE